MSPPRPSPVAPPVERRRKRGRPPLIDAGRIVAAAAGLGADELSLPLLAERMGVSLAAVYRHVHGRDDVLRLLGRHVATAVEPLAHPGGDWAASLLGYARALRAALRRHPAGISHVYAGSSAGPTSLEQADRIVGVLTGAGFTAADAMDAFLLVSNCVFGFVHRELEIEAERRAGRDYLRSVERAMAERGPGELPHLRRLRRLAYAERPPEAQLDEDVRTVLLGLAARCGVPQPELPRRRPAPPRRNGLPRAKRRSPTARRSAETHGRSQGRPVKEGARTEGRGA